MGNCQCYRKDKRPVPAAQYVQNTDNEVTFGPMKLKQKNLSILLVFAKEDAQSDGFWWAADKMGYKCFIAHNAEGALECYLDKHHDVVIIDHRNNKSFDPEALCRVRAVELVLLMLAFVREMLPVKECYCCSRYPDILSIRSSMRATKSSDHTVIVAVTKRIAPEKDEPSVLSLLKAGFNKRIPENHNVNSCINELLCLEYGEVRSQLKLRACSAVFSALDNISEAVQICNEDNQIQYVNPAYERLTGYSADEVIGKDATEMAKADRNKTDLHDTINNQLKKGKFWEGTYHTRRKSSDVGISTHCVFSPILGPGGKLSHIVSVQKTTPDTSYSDRIKEAEYNLANVKLGLPVSFRRRSSGVAHGYPRRRESLAKIHSMTVEAPITKVINIINAAQENSPITVVQALDKVLEILRTSQLYSPHFVQPMKEGDTMTSDLVGGLVSQNVKRQLITSSQESSSVSHSKPVSGHHIHIPNNLLSQMQPEVLEILELEPSWDFNIINLEKATAKRPLVHLGLKAMARFGVCDFLRVDEMTVMNWLNLIEANYHSTNSYHNSTHAADVLHATAFFLTRERNQAVLDQMDQVACLIAAIIHDVDHPGYTNAFLINEKNPLALMYNDQAVLENHHAALGFQLSWKDNSVNIFKNLTRDEYTPLRETIIDMVLATEMKQHFEHLNKFVSCVNKSTLKLEETSSMSGTGSPDSMAIINQLSTPENRSLIKRMLIKCADVSNPCRTTEMCIEWAKRIAEEYFIQTDEEKRRNLPVVMPAFDRKTCSIPKSQTSFIDFFINDMFDAWDYFCDIPDLMAHLQENYRYWKEKSEDEAS
uniref:Phosphodiesterase n=2 Tax=Magallana TaxID=2171616 RepID=A0A8W8I9G5_MAGGI